MAVTVTVDPGTPVRVRRADVAIQGEGARDRYLREELAEFEPKTGDVFDHATYEASKTRITRRLAERGYFDADFASRRVEVTRAEHAADIDLVLGQRHPLRHGRGHLHPDAADHPRRSCWRSWCTGTPAATTTRASSTACAQSLARLDYFSSIDIQPRPEEAVGTRVPVTVTPDPGQAQRLHRRPELRHRQRRRRAPGRWSGATSTSAATRHWRSWTTRRSARRSPCSTASRRSPGWTAGTPSACRPPTSRPTTSTRGASNSSPAAAARSTTT